MCSTMNESILSFIRWFSPKDYTKGHDTRCHQHGVMKNETENAKHWREQIEINVISILACAKEPDRKQTPNIKVLSFKFARPLILRFQKKDKRISCARHFIRYSLLFETRLVCCTSLQNKLTKWTPWLQTGLSHYNLFLNKRSTVLCFA